jgi:two-component SAPR family response regulator
MFGWLWKQKPVTTLGRTIDLAALRKRVKIVVIDDDKNAFPTKELQAEGFSIEYWPRVQSIERLENGDFDIIVLDIAGVAKKFSEKDGLGILEQLKNANPSQIVVAFSGQTFDIDKTRFFKLADDTLAKPVDVLKCKQVLDQLIQTKYTVNGLWTAIVALLKKNGVSDRAVRELEGKLVNAIETKSSTDYVGLLKGVTDKSDIALRVAGLVAKLAALCGV